MYNECQGGSPKTERPKFVERPKSRESGLLAMMMVVVMMLAALAAGLVLVLVRLPQMMVGILFMSVGRMLAEPHITSSKVSRGLLCGRVNGEHSSWKHAKIQRNLSKTSLSK